jgi:hypothetical protein
VRSREDLLCFYFVFLKETGIELHGVKTGGKLKGRKGFSQEGKGAGKSAMYRMSKKKERTADELNFKVSSTIPFFLSLLSHPFSFSPYPSTSPFLHHSTLSITTLKKLTRECRTNG